MSVSWLITLTEQNGRWSALQGTRPWCLLSALLSLHPIRRQLRWPAGEHHYQIFSFPLKTSVILHHSPLTTVSVSLLVQATQCSALPITSSGLWTWIGFVTMFSCLCVFFSLLIRIEQLYQKVLALWHRSHVNMKSVVSWHYLMMDIRNIRKSTVASVSIFASMNYLNYFLQISKKIKENHMHAKLWSYFITRRHDVSTCRLLN